MSWALVTGSAKGLGAETVRQLALNGYSVVIHYNASKVEAEEIAAACSQHGVKAETIQGDFSTPEGVDLFLSHYLKRFKETSVLINNVGNYLMKSASDTTPQELENLFQTNLNAPFALSRALGPSLKKNKGSLINIGVVGLNAPRADTYAAAYTLTKYSLWMLTKSLAKEWAPDLVRVNMVSPGLLENAVDYESVLGHVPMKSAVPLKEAAEAILFLLKPENRHMTGQNLEIAGGLKL
jgi:NAD(P)-dependent dehydrogenase (short-subunit alcohol dehydrogenase family)